MTSYSGAVLLKRLFELFGLASMVEDGLTVHRDLRTYSKSDYVHLILAGLILGFTRLSHYTVLATDGLLAPLFGLPRLPHAVSYWRFLNYLRIFNINQLQEINAKSVARAWDEEEARRGYRRRKATLDFDSSELTVYGKQRGATKGYNKKYGKRCYRPFLCFIAETREFLCGRLRRGNAHDARGLIPFAKRCLLLLPSGTQRITVRADAGFYDGKFLDLLEEAARQSGRQIHYVVVARKTKPIRDKIATLSFRQSQKGYPAFAEFTYRGGWSKARRIVVARDDPEPTNDPQGKLFEEPEYAYRVFVTNLPNRPALVMRTYDKRANVENMIKEAKQSFGLEAIPTGVFQANACYFQMVLLAYNYHVWLKRLGFHEQPPARHQTGQTTRVLYLIIPGRIVRHAGNWHLRITRDYPHKDVFDSTYERLGRPPQPARQAA